VWHRTSSRRSPMVVSRPIAAASTTITERLRICLRSAVRSRRQSWEESGGPGSDDDGVTRVNARHAAEQARWRVAVEGGEQRAWRRRETTTWRMAGMTRSGMRRSEQHKPWRRSGTGKDWRRMA